MSREKRVAGPSPLPIRHELKLVARAHLLDAAGPLLPPDRDGNASRWPEEG